MKNKNTRKYTSRTKKPSRRLLVANLDAAYSQYIRLKDADADGYATCVCCGKRDQWKYLQNGHYASRRYLATRWSDDNCHVCCYRCNVALSGNYVAYTQYMIKRYGVEKIDEIAQRAHKVTKITDAELVALIEVYKLKVKEMLNGE